MAHVHEVERSAGSRHKKKLILVLIITGVYLAAEVIGGILTKSLALWADAGHMLTDAGGLVLALLAIRYGERSPTPGRTYGYYRAEILAALTNAVVLIGISLYILYEAYQRFQDPPKVEGGMMMLIAVVGLIVNLAGLYILRKDSKESLNMKGAYFEVLSDMLTSVAVIAGGAIMLFTGWYYIDPILSAGIGLFILPRTWGLLKESVGVLLEGTPKDIKIEQLRSDLLQLAGVIAVHDLHVWTITSGMPVLTVHLVYQKDADAMEVLQEAQRLLGGQYGIRHTTIQTEREGIALKEEGIHQ
ncbi:cation diffusion facilitator family transporter [Niabella beijingensis]|uniref:cation diffusion facilitator family transporter n=1 Tax=Niabella beijingensis TaxID=2872700 RepID=UPI001CBD0E21|nr:cation diffusion facilitator family transporter [Niabella beijingensis]MBZ4191215.1 cation diffusion facilitator family transporter [Niabella beijingensis]